MASEVVIIGPTDKVVRVPRKVWDLILGCAGQMIDDGDYRDYYKEVPSITLDNVGMLYDKMRAL